MAEKNTITKTNTMTKTITLRQHLQRAILSICDIWDTDYIFDNWEPEFMTIFANWQLRLTLDSIRNSCDVFSETIDTIWKNSLKNSVQKMHEKSTSFDKISVSK